MEHRGSIRPLPMHASHVDCFRRVPILAGLTEEELEALASRAFDRRYEDGEVVFQAGETPGHLYVVASGLVKVVRTSPEGREQIVRLLGAGDFFGELGLFLPQPLPATAIAVGPAHVCLLARPQVEAVLRTSPEASFKVLQALSTRVEELEGLVEQLSLHGVEARVVALLLKLARAQGPLRDGIQITLPLKQEELSKLVGTTQETLSRKLGALEQEGLIRRQDRRGLTLLRIEALQRRLEA